MNTAGAAPIVVVAPGDNLAAAAAELALDRYVDAATSLSRLTLVAPSRALIRPLREALIVAASAAHGAVLGPEIVTYSRWLSRLSGFSVPGRAERELELFDLLGNFPEYFPADERWQHCGTLLPLLEQLELQFTSDQDSVETRTRALTLSHLSREARVVDTVWRAVRQDPDSNLLNRALQMRRAYEALDAPDYPGQALLVACDELSWLECERLRPVLEEQRATLVFQCELPHPNAAIAALMTQVPIAEPTTYNAISSFVSGAVSGKVSPSPAPDTPDHSNRWALVACTDDEAQVRFVANDVEQTLDRSPGVVVVTENRVLARRLRAVLEAKGIGVDDQAGWPASTTAAATVINQLMQCVSDDFAYESMLELLVSPFVETETAKSETSLDAALLLLDKQLVRRRGLFRGLQNYLRAVRSLRAEDVVDTDAVALLQARLEQLAEACAPLEALRRERKWIPCAEAVQLLLQSIDQIGATVPLSRDQAGLQLLDLLRALAERGSTVRLDWWQFRTWLARVFEQESFYPGAQRGQVRLMSLRDAAFSNDDRVYLLGANQHRFPARAGNVSAWFNDQVRYELGLQTHKGALQVFEHRLTVLLSNAATCVACYAKEALGEPQLPAPWLQNLEQHHLALHRKTLTHAYVPPREPPPASDPVVSALSIETAGNPRVPVPRNLIPSEMSASAHQRLIDCPYLYYVNDCLRLRDLDDVDEKMQKLDYGNLVHAALREFHARDDSQQLLMSDFEAAVQLLIEVSRTLFRRHLDSSFEHRAWWYRWCDALPDYLSWQRERAEKFVPDAFETSHAIEFDEHLKISGKIDRVDRSSDGGLAIIDYKTGNAASANQVINGEDVQLTTYALLFDDLQQMEYVRIRNNTSSSAVTEGPDIAATTQRARERLSSLMAALRSGDEAPAWSSDRCRYCPMQGMCRLQTWQHTA